MAKKTTSRSWKYAKEVKIHDQIGYVQYHSVSGKQFVLWMQVNTIGLWETENIVVFNKKYRLNLDEAVLIGRVRYE